MKFIGKILDCNQASEVCGYRCCDQDIPEMGKTLRPDDYIMMYPGEYSSDGDRMSHLKVVGEFAGGVLARCEKECFDQSKCHPDVNYKPLDCKTYPLMPKLDSSGNLDFSKDDRCPLDKNALGEQHKDQLAKAWQEILDLNPQAMGWLLKLTEAIGQ